MWHCTALLPFWHPFSFLRNLYIFSNEVTSSCASPTSDPGYNSSTFDSAGFHSSSTDSSSHHAPSNTYSRSSSGCISSGFPTSDLQFHNSDPVNRSKFHRFQKLYAAAPLVIYGWQMIPFWHKLSYPWVFQPFLL